VTFENEVKKKLETPNPTHGKWVGFSLRRCSVEGLDHDLPANGFAPKGKWNRPSAKGAEYYSQGQALSKAKRVAPGSVVERSKALKVRNIKGIR
jgi:hypothetical protein